MLFPSIEFGVFLAVVLVVSWSLASLRLHTARNLFLLTASLVFYAFWSVAFAGLLVIVATVAYAVGLAISRLRSRPLQHVLLALGITTALGVLVVFKYFDFLVSVVANTGVLGLLDIQPVYLELGIPVAVSFFTFHAISYMVDAWRGKFEPTRSLPDVILYISFFPHLVAGPIVRAADFMPQLRHTPTATAFPFGECIALIVGGLFKKVVLANYLAVGIVDPVFTAPSQFGAADLLAATVAYAFQIYFDFSAYTSIAIGVAALLGYRFPENFNQPYRSLSPREFWTRSHITLSTWLRDYLYIPLGGNRHGMFATIRNLMITMLLGGLWHGASFTFLIWGGVHGLALVVNHLWQKTALSGRLASSFVWKAFSLAAMTVFICATWVLFRSPDFDTAMEVFRGIATRPEGWSSELMTPFLWLIIAIGIVGQFMPKAWTEAFRAGIGRVPALPQVAVFAAAMAVLLLLAPSASAPFIYFQF